MTGMREVIDLCLSFGGVYEDYPFEEGNWAVMRHVGNKKGFAFVVKREGCVWVNVKHRPEDGIIWRELYESVVPAYHMNKAHWSSIILDGTLKESTIRKMLEDSYELTCPKMRKSARIGNV